VTDEAAFLRAIQADPTDATAKLVYADWLDEHGEPERAEYLRLLATEGKAASSLEAQVGWTWAGWVNGYRPSWDAATLCALGKLDTFIDAYLAFNDRTSDISTHFSAILVPAQQPIEDLCRSRCAHGADNVTLEPMEDWPTELVSLFNQWLFVHREDPRPYSLYRIETAEGRVEAANEGLNHVRDVLRPRRGWRVRTQHDSLRQDDLALEAADRVLFLHFSFSD
jgi:uncharacterized protein (TIGR02996 family)